MSVTSSEKKHAAPTLADFQRMLDQWDVLRGEVEDLRRQREELKSILAYHEIVEQLPVLRAERDAVKAKRDTAQIEAQEIRDQARADGEAEKQRLIADGEQVKRSAEQEAARIIGDAKRQAILEATEAAAQERRTLSDEKARLAGDRRDFEQSTKAFREGVKRFGVALDAVDRADFALVTRTSEA